MQVLSPLTYNSNEALEKFALLSGGEDVFQNIDESTVSQILQIKDSVIKIITSINLQGHKSPIDFYQNEDILCILRNTKTEGLKVLVQDFGFETQKDFFEHLKMKESYFFLRRFKQTVLDDILKTIQTLFPDESVTQNEIILNYKIFSSSHVLENIHVLKKSNIIYDSICSVIGILKNDSRLFQFFSRLSSKSLEELVTVLGVSNLEDLKKVSHIKDAAHIFRYREHTLIEFIKYFSINSPSLFLEVFKDKGIRKIVGSNSQSLFTVIDYLNISSLDKLRPLLELHQKDPYPLSHCGEQIVIIAQTFDVTIEEVYLEASSDIKGIRFLLSDIFPSDFQEKVKILGITSFNNFKNVSLLQGVGLYFAKKNSIENIKNIFSLLSIKDYKDILPETFYIFTFSEKCIASTLSYYKEDVTSLRIFLADKESQTIFVKFSKSDEYIEKVIPLISTVGKKYYSLIADYIDSWYRIIDFFEYDSKKIEAFFEQIDDATLLKDFSKEKMTFLTESFGIDSFAYLTDERIANAMRDKNFYLMKEFQKIYAITDIDIFLSMVESLPIFPFIGITDLIRDIKTFFPTLESFLEFSKDTSHFLYFLKADKKSILFLCSYFQITPEEIYDFPDFLKCGKYKIERLQFFFSYFSIKTIKELQKYKYCLPSIRILPRVIYFLKKEEYIGNGDSPEDKDFVARIMSQRIICDMIVDKKIQVYRLIENFLGDSIPRMDRLKHAIIEERQGYCLNNERTNLPILKGEAHSYIVLTFQGKDIGHIKLSGEKTFLSYVDYMTEDGEIGLMKGGIYSISGYGTITEIRLDIEATKEYIYNLDEVGFLQITFGKFTALKSFDTLLSSFLESRKAKQKILINQT